MRANARDIHSARFHPQPLRWVLSEIVHFPLVIVLFDGYNAIPGGEGEVRGVRGGERRGKRLKWWNVECKSS